MADLKAVSISTEPAGVEAPAPVSNPLAEPTSEASPKVTESARPEWLPEKFKDPQDLAKAYAALESKLGKPAEPVAEAATSDPLAIKEAPPAPEDPDAFIETYSKEFMETGALSDQSYDALKAKGFSRKMVDSFIAGQQAVLEQARNQVFSLAGGAEGYQEMVNWASTNLNKTEIDAFNKAVTSGDPAMINMAVSGLSARHKTAQGPKLMQGSSSTGPDGFASRAELAKAVADPRYKNDPGYRRRVEEKLKVSRFV